MDFVHPIRSVIPGAQGRLLEVLANSSGELSLRSLARLSNVSTAQASRLLPKLVQAGIVERRDVPPSVQFKLVREHLGARAVIALNEARSELTGEMGAVARRLPVEPASIIVFGSFATGDAVTSSDIDSVLVRPAGISDDDERWADSVEQWQSQIQRAAGNSVSILEYDLDEVVSGLARGRGVWSSIRRDGIVVFGLDFDQLDVALRV